MRARQALTLVATVSSLVIAACLTAQRLEPEAARADLRIEAVRAAAGTLCGIIAALEKQMKDQGC